MHPAKVSVIIPAYNCQRFLRQTIESILAQRDVSLEIIVINDGSTDETGEIAKSFGSPVRVINQENSGVCRARNLGLQESQGEFIAFMDHDDYWLPLKLSEQLRAFDTYPAAGVVFTNFRWWRPDQSGYYELLDTQSESEMSETLVLDPEYCGWIYHRMLFDSWVLTSTALSRREVFTHCGAFDETLPFSEDWDLWLRVSRKFQFVKLASMSTLYRQHPTQGSRVVRDIDYRTILIEKALRTWGYCGPDGQCADARSLSRRLAEYHTQFALHHVRSGSKTIALRSFIKALRADLTYVRSGAYAIASLIGWRPNW